MAKNLCLDIYYQIDEKCIEGNLWYFLDFCIHFNSGSMKIYLRRILSEISFTIQYTFS